MASLEDLQKRVIKFRDARDWKQFHNPKDLSVSLLLEASELLEHFQWKTPKEMEEHLKSEKFQDVKEELADILYWVLLIGHDLKIDLPKAFSEKMTKNEKKYPVAKAKGSHKKYTEI